MDKKWRTFVCLAVVAAPALADETEKKRPVPVYTNEDLERVRPFRDETGVASVPASWPPDPLGAVGPRARRAGSRASDSGVRDEAWWRREAARVRDRESALDLQAAELRRRITEARAEPWSSRRRRAVPDTRPWQARLAAIEERRRALEDDLLERARRAGALPGWLR
ncbi:MAG TPA: hypothetical protein VF964_08415 [Vicinamibacteria bacterium]